MLHQITYYKVVCKEKNYVLIILHTFNLSYINVYIMHYSSQKIFIYKILEIMIRLKIFEISQW
jgi:hypothetical protein